MLQALVQSAALAGACQQLSAAEYGVLGTTGATTPFWATEPEREWSIAALTGLKGTTWLAGRNQAKRQPPAGPVSQWPL